MAAGLLSLLGGVVDALVRGLDGPLDVVQAAAFRTAAELREGNRRRRAEDAYRRGMNRRIVPTGEG
jgi:hypothetical protein